MKMFNWRNDLTASFDTAGDWPGAGPSTDPEAIPFNAGGGLGSTGSATSVATKAPKLTTLVSFTGADGEAPYGSLITDAGGDLFGTTDAGGSDGDGTVFEIAKTKKGYASEPTTLVSFTGSNGEEPVGSLLADAAGNLLGTTEFGGANGFGTVFEIAKTKQGYASAPTILFSCTISDGTHPQGSLIADAAGDLLGTAYSSGANGDGTVFEIAKTKQGYASAPTVLFNFTGADGAGPQGSLLADAAGDLFGTTYGGGAHGDGTVFEIAKTKSGYAAATTLVSFTGSNGDQPLASLIFDAAGDLFGTTSIGGGDNVGTVFEIAKTKSGYASAPTILYSFTGAADGEAPYGSLIADAAGDLFGTAAEGGSNGDGTVFEIAKTNSGYASKPTTLVSFTGSNGAYPLGGLIADAEGDLFSTTVGYGSGPDGDGTVFEITNSGFTPPATPVTPAAHGAHASPTGAAFAQAMASFGASRSGETSPTFLASRHETSMHLSLPHQVA